MLRATESRAQRRKLLHQIVRLADVAVFGTVSETYRTCGRPGCHCQQRGGQKHGPHLNVSYRGETGKTTGYYPNFHDFLSPILYFQALSDCCRHYSCESRQALTGFITSTGIRSVA